MEIKQFILARLNEVFLDQKCYFGQREMTSPTKVLKSVGPKLVPFFKTVAIYFVLFMRVEKYSWVQMGIKCLPILSLIFFVLLHGMSLGDEYAYSRRILLGLIFSCFGDAFLVWPNYFLHGMAAFGVAQIIYISAFGFKPLNLPLGISLYVTTTLANCILLNNLSGILLFCVPIYGLLLTTMTWRAIARVQFFEELWTWTKLCSCAGGILFLASDTILGFNEFYTPIPYSQVLIMVTYYAAQVGIALSIVDSKESFREEIKKSDLKQLKPKKSHATKIKNH